MKPAGLHFTEPSHSASQYTSAWKHLQLHTVPVHVGQERIALLNSVCRRQGPWLQQDERQSKNAGRPKEMEPNRPERQATFGRVLSFTCMKLQLLAS